MTGRAGSDRFALHWGRWFSSTGKKILNDPFLTNEGNGPAFDLVIALGFEVPGRPDLAWGVGEKPLMALKSSLSTGMSLDLDHVRSLIQMYLVFLKANGIQVDRPKASPRFRADMAVIYHDRGQTTFSQTFSFFIIGDLDTYPLSSMDPNDFALLGDKDPHFQELVAKEVTATLVGLVQILDPLSGPVRRVVPWIRNRREIRKALRWREALRRQNDQPHPEAVGRSGEEAL